MNRANGIGVPDDLRVRLLTITLRLHLSGIGARRHFLERSMATIMSVELGVNGCYSAWAHLVQHARLRRGNCRDGVWPRPFEGNACPGKNSRR